ncbi:MAG: hypothetical protein JWM12_96 [Ilumatobacteraceae bacterium]|nr:hypothetical protein [Ilumatobacteraceae bacterium]
MTDVMQRCVPVSTGKLGPDLRVNYQFGLVLGVDEFEQEALYLRERDDRLTRIGHGIGTFVGLHVTAARPMVAPLDVEVRVEPGIAADQYGRHVVVRTAQCARVGAWIAAAEHDAATNKLPSPLQAHLRPSGDLTLYVVASYAECPDALVPLPGNPCGCDDDVTAASRLRDSWDLELRWEPPVMQQWDGVRALADLLLPVEVHDGSLLETDEDALAAHIRALRPDAAPAAAVLPPVPVLPRAEARAALDRLLTIWITEVRPTLAPDLIGPGGDAAVLLSALTVVPADPFETTSPSIVAFDLPDDEGRPYLAPTQLIQELVQMGAGITTILTGSPIERPATAVAPLVELTTIVETGTGANRRLVLWPHLALPLAFPPTIQVSRNGGVPVAFTTAPGPKPGTTALVAPANAPLVDEELLTITLDLAQVRAVDAGAGVETALSAWLPQNGVDLVDRIGTTLTLSYVAAPARVINTTETHPTTVVNQTLPVRTLATATGRLVASDGQGLRPNIDLWFHVHRTPDDDADRVDEPKPEENVRLVAELGDDGIPTTTPVRISDMRRLRKNVYRFELDLDSWDEVKRSPYIRVLVDANRLGLDSGATIAEWGQKLEVEFADTLRDGNEQFVVFWVELPGVER